MFDELNPLFVIGIGLNIVGLLAMAITVKWPRGGDWADNIVCSTMLLSFVILSVGGVTEIFSA